MDASPNTPLNSYVEFCYADLIRSAASTDR